MARIILKSPYLKPNAKSHAANYVRYISTRDGVENPLDSKGTLPATMFQTKTGAQIVKDYPDTTELYEYEDYCGNPTRANAEEFIIRAAEAHPELLDSRERYVSYIATRPGAVHIADHGLFGDSDNAVILNHVMEEVANHSGNVWCHIISLRREDAERLGYDSVGAWQELLKSQRNTISAAMNIHPNNFRWYAAFHNKEHHPHCHLMAWSAKPAEPWLSEEGIGKIKASLAKQIFKNDLMQTYERQTEQRDTLRQDSRAVAAEIVRQINSGRYDNPVAENLLLKLADRLKNLSGKKVYGYLPPDVKATVDLIVDELAKDERIARLYDLWYEQRQEVMRTYTDKPVERVPLSQNDDFKPVKNAVIDEAQNILLDRLTFEDAAMDDEAPDESDQAGQEPDAPEPSPQTASGEREPNENKYTLYRKAKKLLDKAASEFDPQAAIPLLLQSAQQGYEWAQYLLGKLYISGAGMPKDAEKAVRFFTESAEQGNQYAQYQLGKMLLYGKEVEQDAPRGIALLSDSAAQGNVYAQKELDSYDSFKGSAGMNAALGSLRLLGRLSQIMKNRLDDEARRDGSAGLIDRKLRREIEEKKQAHGLRMGG